VSAVPPRNVFLGENPLTQRLLKDIHVSLAALSAGQKFLLAYIKLEGTARDMFGVVRV
jgi:hypothetical protein